MISARLMMKTATTTGLYSQHHKWPHFPAVAVVLPCWMKNMKLVAAS